MDTQRTDKDILSGLDPSFITSIKSLAKGIRFTRRSIIFRQGSAADYFFTLVAGKVSLCLGQKGHVIYSVGHSGEAFGWSSLTGGNVYMASAVSDAGTTVLKFNGNELRTLLAKRPRESLKFYQNLSRTLDRRLHQSHDVLASIATDDGDPGPMQDPFELI